MARASITVERRDGLGSPETRRLRRSGRIPGIVYRSGGSIPIAADAHDLMAVLRAKPTIIELTVGDDTYHSVVKDIQEHPVKLSVEHIDLQAVDLDQTVRVNVPVVAVGTPVGLKQGGVLAQLLHEITIDARPGDIPEQVEVDVSGLGVSESLMLSDVTIPEGVELIVDDPEVVSVAAVNKTRLSLSTAATSDDADGEGEGEGEAGGDDAGSDGAGEE